MPTTCVRPIAAEGGRLGATRLPDFLTEHGGRIWDENIPEGGAVFTIDRPIGEPEPAREPLRIESPRL